MQSTPLVDVDGAVVGMLSTHWRTQHAPSAADLRRIDALAQRCASAVVRERQRSVDERSAVRAHLLHQVNERIREIAARFESIAVDDAPQEYLCECGCGQRVSLRSSEFDATLAAHRSVAAPGHVVARAIAKERRGRQAAPATAERLAEQGRSSAEPTERAGVHVVEEAAEPQSPELG